MPTAAPAKFSMYVFVVFQTSAGCSNLGHGTLLQRYLAHLQRRQGRVLAVPGVQAAQVPTGSPVKHGRVFLVPCNCTVANTSVTFLPNPRTTAMFIWSGCI